MNNVYINYVIIANF